MSEQRCENCRFWKRLPKDEEEPGLGDCKRHAPRPIIALSGLRMDECLSEIYWPETREEDWCGEWQAITTQSDPPDKRRDDDNVLFVDQ